MANSYTTELLKGYCVFNIGNDFCLTLLRSYMGFESCIVGVFCVLKNKGNISLKVEGKSGFECH